MPKAPSMDEIAQAMELLRRATGVGVEVKTVTVRELWEAWASSVGEARVREMDHGRVKPVLAFFGDLPAHAVGFDDVDRYRAKRRTEITMRGGPTAPASRDREVCLLMMLFTWAVKRRRMAAHPLRGCEMEVKWGDNARKTALDEPKIAKLLAAAHPILRALVLLGHDSGMRRDELRRLRRDQVDWETGVLKLYSNETKTRTGRLVPMTYRALKALRDLPDTGPYIFGNPFTKLPYSRTHVREMFLVAVAASGLKGVAGESVWLHDATRRSFITNSIRRGLTETATMKITGHKSRKVFDRYLCLTENDITASVRHLETEIAREVRAERKDAQRAPVDNLLRKNRAASSEKK